MGRTSGASGGGRRELGEFEFGLRNPSDDSGVTDEIPLSAEEKLSAKIEKSIVVHQIQMTLHELKSDLEYELGPGPHCAEKLIRDGHPEQADLLAPGFLAHLDESEIWEYLYPALASKIGIEGPSAIEGLAIQFLSSPARLFIILDIKTAANMNVEEWRTLSGVLVDCGRLDPDCTPVPQDVDDDSDMREPIDDPKFAVGDQVVRRGGGESPRKRLAFRTGETAARSSWPPGEAFLIGSVIRVERWPDALLLEFNIGESRWVRQSDALRCLDNFRRSKSAGDVQ